MGKDIGDHAQPTGTYDLRTIDQKQLAISIFVKKRGVPERGEISDSSCVKWNDGVLPKFTAVSFYLHFLFRGFGRLE